MNKSHLLGAVYTCVASLVALSANVSTVFKVGKSTDILSITPVQHASMAGNNVMSRCCDIPKRIEIIVRYLFVGLILFSAAGFRYAQGSQVLLVPSGGTNEVLRYNGTTGTFIDDFVPASSGGLLNPKQALYGPDGNLYVSGGTTAGMPAILRYNGTTGGFIDVFASAGAGGGAFNPFGIAFGPDGNLYSTDRNADTIIRFDGASGAFIDTFASGGMSNARGLIFGPDGNLYVSAPVAEAVLKFDGTTGSLIGTFTNTDVDARGLTFGPDGNLYVADFLNDSIFRFNGTTGVFIDEFISTGSGGLDGPVGVLFGPDSNLYVGSWESDEMLRYNGLTGAFIDEFVTAGSGGLDAPRLFTFAAVPLPAAVWLFGSGLICLIGITRRKKT